MNIKTEIKEAIGGMLRAALGQAEKPGQAERFRIFKRRARESASAAHEASEAMLRAIGVRAFDAAHVEAALRDVAPTMALADGWQLSVNKLAPVLGVLVQDVTGATQITAESVNDALAKAGSTYRISMLANIAQTMSAAMVLADFIKKPTPTPHNVTLPPTTATKQTEKPMRTAFDRERDNKISKLRTLAGPARYASTATATAKTIEAVEPLALPPRPPLAKLTSGNRAERLGWYSERISQLCDRHKSEAVMAAAGVARDKERFLADFVRALEAQSIQASEKATVENARRRVASLKAGAAFTPTLAELRCIAKNIFGRASVYYVENKCATAAESYAAIRQFLFEQRVPVDGLDYGDCKTTAQQETTAHSPLATKMANEFAKDFCATLRGQISLEKADSRGACAARQFMREETRMDAV